ncbi:MAG: hypothetical protein IH804_10595, partial [Planctomycetes bacterium]|nr:hypothetical protein [Planctomycetota bacterium]
PGRAAIPMILATGGIHSHLVAQSLRTFTSLNVRSAECLDVHYFAVLIGVGGDHRLPLGVVDVQRPAAGVGGGREDRRFHRVLQAQVAAALTRVSGHRGPVLRAQEDHPTAMLGGVDAKDPRALGAPDARLSARGGGERPEDAATGVVPHRQVAPRVVGPRPEDVLTLAGPQVDLPAAGAGAGGRHHPAVGVDHLEAASLDHVVHALARRRGQANAGHDRPGESEADRAVAPGVLAAPNHLMLQGVQSSL